MKETELKYAIISLPDQVVTAPCGWRMMIKVKDFYQYDSVRDIQDTLNRGLRRHMKSCRKCRRS